MAPSTMRVAILAVVLGLPASPSQTAEILLGQVSRKEILSIAPEWQAQYDGYAPAAADVAALPPLPRGARLEVYFGSWCGDSRVGVPHLLRILDDARDARLKVRFYAVDRTKKEPAGLLEGVGLERVPTFVLSVKGHEVGRIVEAPRTTLEHDLALLIAEARGPAGS
jgi:thiol-disulfide isomerase/thioredoxin